ncbi:unnamed protein product [Lota lota]
MRLVPGVMSAGRWVGRPRGLRADSWATVEEEEHAVLSKHNRQDARLQVCVPAEPPGARRNITPPPPPPPGPTDARSETIRGPNWSVDSEHKPPPGEVSGTF